jgi:hypothetical protein
MSDRGAQLARTAERQISQLTEILSTGGEAALRLPCPGRERMGDGTVAAVAEHITENYHRIAGLIRDDPVTGDRAEHGHDTGSSAESISLRALLARLAAARDVVAALAGVADNQLDSVPSAGALRFADGQRTVEQVFAAALKHQQHQIDALKTGVAVSERSPQAHRSRRPLRDQTLSQPSPGTR